MSSFKSFKYNDKKVEIEHRILDEFKSHDFAISYTFGNFVQDIYSNYEIGQIQGWTKKIKNTLQQSIDSGVILSEMKRYKHIFYTQNQFQ